MDRNRWHDYHGLTNARYVGKATPEDHTMGIYQIGLYKNICLKESLKWVPSTTPTGEGYGRVEQVWSPNDNKPNYQYPTSAKLWIDTVNNNTIAIEGTVWEDVPLTKAHTYNNVYDKNGGSGKVIDDETIEERTEKGLGGITVRIKEGSSVVATTMTKDDGTYVFDRSKGIKINKLDDGQCCQLKEFNLSLDFT